MSTERTDSRALNALNSLVTSIKRVVDATKGCSEYRLAFTFLIDRGFVCFVRSIAVDSKNYFHIVFQQIRWTMR